MCVCYFHRKNTCSIFFTWPLNRIASWHSYRTHTHIRFIPYIRIRTHAYVTRSTNADSFARIAHITWSPDKVTWRYTGGAAISPRERLEIERGASASASKRDRSHLFSECSNLPCVNVDRGTERSYTRGTETTFASTSVDVERRVESTPRRDGWRATATARTITTDKAVFEENARLHNRWATNASHWRTLLNPPIGFVFRKSIAQPLRSQMVTLFIDGNWRYVE